MQNIILFKAEEDSADEQKTMIYSEKFFGPDTLNNERFDIIFPHKT